MYWKQLNFNNHIKINLLSMFMRAEKDQTMNCLPLIVRQNFIGIEYSIWIHDLLHLLHEAYCTIWLREMDVVPLLEAQSMLGTDASLDSCGPLKYCWFNAAEDLLLRANNGVPLMGKRPTKHDSLSIHLYKWKINFVNGVEMNARKEHFLYFHML